MGQLFAIRELVGAATFCVRAWDHDCFHNSLHYSASVDTNRQSAGRAFVPHVDTASRASYMSIITLRLKKKKKKKRDIINYQSCNES